MSTEYIGYIHGNDYIIIIIKIYPVYPNLIKERERERLREMQPITSGGINNHH